MKKFMGAMLTIKAQACLAFTTMMLIYAVIALIAGQRAMSLAKMLQMMGLCLVGAALQYLCFGQDVIKNMRYTRRMVLFLVPFALALTAFALLFRWFPIADWRGWLLFVGLFVAIFAAMTGAFEVYFRVTGKRYDGLLGEYKRRKKQDAGQ